MKPRLAPFFAIFMAAIGFAGALGQTCERTLTVGLHTPGLGAGDFLPTLDRQTLEVTKVEPIRSSRLLILVPASFYNLVTHKKDFQQMIARLSGIDGIPENVSLAYGLYAEKIIFSAHFTSNAQELRSSLDDLVSKANSGALGRVPPNDDCLLGQVFDFFGHPQPGDSVIQLGAGITFCDRGSHDWVHNDQAAQGSFLGSGLRSFGLTISCEGWAGDCGGPHTNGTGGHSDLLNGLGNDKRQEEVNWQAVKAFWLNGIGKGYLVTVAVPEKAKAGHGTWNLALGGTARTRLGIPAKARLGFDYPDLLLCSPAKGSPAIATADR
jgi:hypothetical protein